MYKYKNILNKLQCRIKVNSESCTLLLLPLTTLCKLGAVIKLQINSYILSIYFNNLNNDWISTLMLHFYIKQNICMCGYVFNQALKSPRGCFQVMAAPLQVCLSSINCVQDILKTKQWYIKLCSGHPENQAMHWMTICTYVQHVHCYSYTYIIGKFTCVLACMYTCVHTYMQTHTHRYHSNCLYLYCGFCISIMSFVFQLLV